MPNPEPEVAGQVYLGLEDEGTNHTPGSGEPVVEPVVQVDPTPEPIDTPVDPKDDPKRLEYWQSRADKANKRAESLERLAPLGKLLEERPDIVQVIQEKVTGKVAEPPKPALVKPSVPPKPADYDSVAAVSDPESPSFKYRTSLETYQEQVLDFYDKKEALRQEQYEQERTLASRKEQAAVADAKLRARLQEKGIVGTEVERFIQVMDSPQSFDLDNLIAYYNVVQGKGAPKPPDAKLAELNRRGAATRVPLPAGIEGGENPAAEPESEEQTLNESFLAVGKQTARRNRPVIVKE